MNWPRFMIESLAAVALTGCSPQAIGPADTQIESRTMSPNGNLEAIYAEDVGGGPAVGVTEEVFVVERGHFPKLEERVFSEECVRNLATRWVSSHDLEINYDVAADLAEHPHPYEPSPLKVFSSGYWTFSHPHGVNVHFIRNITARSGSC